MSVLVRALLLVAAVGFALPSAASARVVQCGEVITADTRVSNDLACPTPVALEIGANGVDLDLGGHTIEAVEFVDETGSVYEEGTGLVVPGYDDVSVANGTVIGHVSLGYGLRASDADRLSLRRLRTRGYGSLIVSGDAIGIAGVHTRGFSASIISSGAVIDGLTTETELDVAGQAVEVTDGDFRSFAGFTVDDSSLRRNGLAEDLIVRGSRNAIVRNAARSAFLGAGGGNTVRANRLASLVLEPDFSGNVIRNNIVSGTAELPETDGIFVPAGAAGNALVANSASGSGDDGIDVEEPSTTLADNRAFDNADLGIEAVAGVIDGGGNRAWGNGNPLQCLNVDCG
jgi:hypothetical protein